MSSTRIWETLNSRRLSRKKWVAELVCRDGRVAAAAAKCLMQCFMPFCCLPEGKIYSTSLWMNAWKVFVKWGTPEENESQQPFHHIWHLSVAGFYRQSGGSKLSCLAPSLPFFLLTRFYDSSGRQCSLTVGVGPRPWICSDLLYSSECPSPSWGVGVAIRLVMSSGKILVKNNNKVGVSGQTCLAR